MNNISSSPQDADSIVRGGAREKSQDSPELHRIVVSKEANVCLEAVVTKVNQDLEDGAVNRTAVANYVFKNIGRLLTEADLKAIKALNFDDKKALGTLLKSEAELPEELKRALREHFGISEGSKKRAARAVPEATAEQNGSNASAE